MCSLLHSLISKKKKKNTALLRGYAKVQRPSISFNSLNNFLLIEACFNVYNLVLSLLPIFRPLFYLLFVLAWSLNEINYYYYYHMPLFFIDS